MLFADLHKAGKSKDLHDSMDYRAATKKIFAHAESDGRLTVEGVATDLASLCLEEDLVKKVRVHLEKPGAVRFSRSVGVEIERVKEDNFQGNGR